jgi:hypothetical protein
MAIGWGGATIANSGEVLRDFDLRGDARALFEQVARAYGLQCRFDADYGGGREIRFQMQEADYRTALHALEAATGSIVIPISANVLLIAKDTPEKRALLEPHVAVTIEIPQATSPQEVTEAATVVQQALAIEKVGVNTQGNRLVLRGSVSRIVPAQALFNELLHYRPQVSVEIKLLEVTHTEMLAYGLTVPQVFPIVSSALTVNGLTPLNLLGKGAFGGFALGINFATASLVAQMQASGAKSLLDMELRASNNQAAAFHLGDRYPIVTAQYVAGPTASNTNNPGNTGTGSTTATPATFGQVSKPSAPVIADFNGDGVQDLASAAGGSDSAAVLLGNSDGSFRDAVLYATGSAPAAIVTGDVNGDSRLDLITADSGSNTVSVLPGNGDGTFGTAAQFKVGSKPVALVLTDLNGDGFLDIVTANSDSNDVSILLGHGDGTFASALTVSVGTGPAALVAVDLNADGKIDLAIANFGSNDVSILLGNGDGSFLGPVNYAVGKSPMGIANGDMNLDGRPDLVTANSGDGTVSVLAGDGTGAFAAAVAYPAGSRPTAVAIADFNLDGIKDVVVANPDDGTVSQLLGLGSGGLQQPIAYHTGTSPDSLTIIDFNKDGLPDVIAASSSNGNFTLMLFGAGGFHDPAGNTFTPTGGSTYQPTPSFSFEDLGLVVKTTPHVHAGGDVTVDLDVEFKLITSQPVSGPPVISNRKLTTQARIPNGEWAVVGGLLSSSDAHTLDGIPGLRILGKRERDRASSEILLLIKTELLSRPPDESSPAIPLGSDTRPRVPY